MQHFLYIQKITNFLYQFKEIKLMLQKNNLEWMSEWKNQQENYDLYTTATKSCKDVSALFLNLGAKWLNECMGVVGWLCKYYYLHYLLQ